MNARRVHAVLAAGVDNPALIAEWQQEPMLLHHFGIQPDSLDLTALRKFTGLTVKVRHNGVRQQLPLTFRLLGLGGLEVELFAAYALHRAACCPRYASAIDERIRDLAEFLEHWLSPDRLDHALVWDMVRHEHTLLLLAASSPDVPDSTDPRDAIDGESRTVSRWPILRGHVVLHQMRCNPLQVAAVLRQHEPRLADLDREPRYFCYWRSEASAEIRVIELDAFGYYVLSSIDGRRSISAISRLLTGTAKPAPVFLQLLRELASTGIVALPRPRRSRAL